MVTRTIGRVAACVMLALSSGLAHADAASSNGKIAVPAARPVVKLGQAMVQEREVLPGGAVRTQTTFLPVTSGAGKNSPAPKTGK